MLALLKALCAHAPNRSFASIVLGALAGACYALLIPLLQIAFEPIDRSQHWQSAPPSVLGFEIWHYKAAAAYFLVCCVVLLLRTGSQLLLTRISVEMVSAMRKKIYARVMATGTRDLEQLGPSRVISVINIDVARVVTGARMLPDILISVVSIVGMLMFIWIISPEVLGYVTVAILLGAASYLLIVRIASTFFARARVQADALQDAIRCLLYGAKELKLSEAKRRHFQARELDATEDRMLQLDSAGQLIYRLGMNYGDMIGFLVIGFVAFCLAAAIPLSSSQTAAVVMPLLYLTAPMALLLNYIPHIAQARVSLAHIDALFAEIQPEPAHPPLAEIAWNEVRFDAVTFSYCEKGVVEDRQFMVGPLDFHINRGEIVFVVGGNGSGKSTLAKLVSLHYRRDSGEIRFGDVAVDDATLQACREGVGAIFADFFLFDTVYGGRQCEAALIDGYLEKLGLAHKVAWRDGKFSTLALSQGQRKRLALLVAFLEDKQLYVFDEWAADQDPEFKEFFYRSILLELKDRGKAVLVISHDEKFFDVADKTIHMDSGVISSIQIKHRPPEAHDASHLSST